jgi:predicted kinase
MNTNFLNKNKPIIIACGLSGTGKSFNAIRLENFLSNYIRLNPELIRHELGLTHYSRKDTPKILAKIIEKIEEHITDGKGVIVDANLKSNDLRQSFYDLGKHLKKDVLLIEFVCDDEESRRRIQNRKSLDLKVNHPVDPKVYDNQKRTWQDIEVDTIFEENGHVSFIRFDSLKGKAEIVDVKNSHADIVKQLIKLLES